MKSLITGPWTLIDLAQKKIGKINNGLKVFSCFHCGGGSTMGYKLAGFNVLGGVEIDPKMMDLYKTNFSPNYSYLMGIQNFNLIPNNKLESELFDLDILDGSPPCSSFSLSGNREKDWGKEKKFKEGQALQILDDLFFHFIETAKKLSPKIVIAENVKGLIIGNAKGYVKQIFSGFEKAGYDVQLFLLNASVMGVPQRRERTFFIARRRDLKLSELSLNFEETPISFELATKGTSGLGAKELTEKMKKWWFKVPPGKNVSEFHLRKMLWNIGKVHPKNPVNTITASNLPFHWKEPRYLSPAEVIRLQSFPDDYNFKDQPAGYVCGMSVPPFMMQRLSLEIAHQFFGIS